MAKESAWTGRLHTENELQEMIADFNKEKPPGKSTTMHLINK